MSRPKFYPLDPEGELKGGYLGEADGYQFWMVDSPYEASQPTDWLRHELESLWPGIRRICRDLQLLPPKIFFARGFGDVDGVALYFAGSSADPCLALSTLVDWESSPEQVLVSVAHELAHARLESVFGEETCAVSDGHSSHTIERAVETFGRLCADSIPAALDYWLKMEPSLAPP